MSFATVIGEMLESGKVTVSANNVEAIEIKAANKKIDINALDKKFLKQALTATRDDKKSKGTLDHIKGTVGQIKTARSLLAQLKEVAEELSKAGITVTLTYRGDVVVTMVLKQSLNYQVRNVNKSDRNKQSKKANRTRLLTENKIAR
jgi:hypothetical protein